MSDDPLSDLIRKRRARRARMRADTPEKEIQRLAIRMFLTVGTGVIFLMVSVILLGMTLMFASAGTILTRPYRVYIPYTLGGSIVSAVLGFFILKRELIEDEDPYIPPQYKQEIQKMLRDSEKI